MRDLRVLNPRVLDSLEGLTVVFLLELVVLCEEGTFVFAVGALDVIDAFGDDTETLFAFLLFFLPLFDLEPHEVIRVEVLDVLYGSTQLAVPAAERKSKKQE